MAKILIVDDEEDMRSMLSRAVAMFGHEAITASDGYTVMEQFVKHKPDLAILDFMMPAGAGHQVLANIRGTDWGSKTPVIFVSALPRMQVESNVLDQTNVTFLSKPVDLDELKLTLAEMLGGSTAAG